MLTDPEAIFLQRLSPKAREKISSSLKNMRENPKQESSEKNEINDFFDEIFKHDVIKTSRATIENPIKQNFNLTARNK
mgnify:CR=1 FL=1